MQMLGLNDQKHKKPLRQMPKFPRSKLDDNALINSEATNYNTKEIQYDFYQFKQ